MSLSNISGGGTWRQDVLNAQFWLLLMKWPQKRQFGSVVSSVLHRERRSSLQGWSPFPSQQTRGLGGCYFSPSEGVLL